MPLDHATINDVACARCGDPFAHLGLQESASGWELRTLLRGAVTVTAHWPSGASMSLACAHDCGLWWGALGDLRPEGAYLLKVNWGDGSQSEVADPFAFWPQLADFDLERFHAGQHHHLEQFMGSRQAVVDGCPGVRFAVWAPQARRVCVMGDWNGFDGRYHPMRCRHPYGVWEIFIPGIGAGERYKYEILGADGRVEAKADPFARECEIPPATASIIPADEPYQWQDDAWMQRRAANDWQHRPMAIYEVHPGSWQRGEENRHLSWEELAQRLVEHCQACHFTHVEFLPLSAHPYEGSWGYQVSGYYAPNSRHGSPAQLKYLIDRLHAAGIGVIVDFVPAHFPKDGFALGRFDGSPCFEYADPREGEHREWGTLIFNYKRNEVRNFLLGSALFWLREFHVDGLRVDAVSAMLYRNYDRREGEWIPNVEGGNANLEAVSFLQELNGTVHHLFAGVVMCAEESTAWQGTTAPTEWQGLGFDLKWNMGWMHDTLRYLAEDPLMRAGVHDRITFHQWYAYDERWILPLSHDEVVHGKGSLLDKMRGDYGQRLASLRLLYGYQVGVPGRKLLFQGAEIGQGREWAWARSLDWHEGEYPERAALCRWLGEALALYAAEPALHAADDSREGFQWVDCENARESILAFMRKAPGQRDVLVVCNFTPVARHAYPLGASRAGAWEVLLNSDDQRFGGSGQGASMMVVASTDERLGSWPATLRLPLAPLSVTFLASPE
ncbi:MAG: 1,4-alpha-glucan branching protein GlgB [Planctomycetota bacterium]|nr:MAG: 1,4-alpha-glucan branching protein GlgB [Planctomycetota bacterium]